MTASFSRAVILSSGDLKTLVNELHDVRADWYDLGVQLEIQTHNLDVFRLKNQSDTNKCLRQMLSVWLLHEFPSPPSWERVVDALSSPAIDRPTVAERIRRTYCSQSSDAATDTESFLSP